MTRLVIDSVSYVTLETLAGCYRCEISWVREVYDYGLLGTGRQTDSGVAVEIGMLERMASIVRWSRYQGLEFDVVAALLIGDDVDAI